MSCRQNKSRTPQRQGRADLPVGRDARQRVPTGPKWIGRVRMAQGVSRNRGVRASQSLPLLWRESSWQVRIRVSRAGDHFQPGRIPASPNRKPAIRSGARLCDPQLAGRFGDARRLRESFGLSESPRSCASQTRAPRVAALPRDRVCGPRRAVSTLKPPFHRL